MGSHPVGEAEDRSTDELTIDVDAFDASIETEGGIIGLGMLGIADTELTGGGGIVPTTGEDIIGGTIGITEVVGLAPACNAGDSLLDLSVFVGCGALDDGGAGSGGGGT